MFFPLTFFSSAKRPASGSPFRFAIDDRSFFSGLHPLLIGIHGQEGDEYE